MFWGNKKVSNPSDQKLVEYKNMMSNLLTYSVENASNERPRFHPGIPEIDNVNLVSVNAVNNFVQFLNCCAPKM